MAYGKINGGLGPGAAIYRSLIVLAPSSPFVAHVAIVSMYVL
jgi:hypothetical protein